MLYPVWHSHIIAKLSLWHLNVTVTGRDENLADCWCQTSY